MLIVLLGADRLCITELASCSFFMVCFVESVLGDRLVTNDVLGGRRARARFTSYPTTTRDPLQSGESVDGSRAIGSQQPATRHATPEPSGVRRTLRAGWAARTRDWCGGTIDPHSPDFLVCGSFLHAALSLDARTQKSGRLRSYRVRCTVHTLHCISTRCCWTTLIRTVETESVNNRKRTSEGLSRYRLGHKNWEGSRKLYNMKEQRAPLAVWSHSACVPAVLERAILPQVSNLNSNNSEWRKKKNRVAAVLLHILAHSTRMIIMGY